MEPLFLTLEEVLEIHRDEIDRYGGTLGVRDNGLLESAVAAPLAGFGGHYLMRACPKIEMISPSLLIVFLEGCDHACS